MTRMYVQYEKIFGHLEDIGRTNRANTADNDRYLFGGRNVTFFWREPFPIINKVSREHWPEAGDTGFGHIDCSGSMWSAFYLEYQRQKGDLTRPENKALRPLFEAYSWWIPFGSLPDGRQKREASTYALEHYFDAGFRLGELTEMRRGDLVQLWWNGEAPLPEDKHWSGHNVVVWDTCIDAEGRLFYQYASAQTHKSTDGMGVGETKLERFDSSLELANQVGVLSNSFLQVGRGSRTQYAARFHRACPYFPVELGAPQEADRFEQGGALVEGGWLPAYYLNVEGSPGAPRAGGTFPVGRHRTWHGGVHLHPAAPRAKVHAIADGVIVAARMDPVDEALDDAREAHPEHHLPSRNFVLIQHRATIDDAEQVFYSLYAHLDTERDPASLYEARWRWKLEKNPRLDGLRKLLGHGHVARLAEPVAAGDVIGHVAPSDGGSPFVHVSVLSAGAQPITTFDGGETIDDPDDDVFADVERMLELLFGQVDKYGNWVGDFLGWRDGVLRPGEIESFFADPTASQRPLRDAFRRFVVRYKSEWCTDISWTDIGDTKRFGYANQDELDALADAFALYGFLDGPVLAHCGLPADGKLWHYHPVTFLWWLRVKVYRDEAIQRDQHVRDFIPGHRADLVAGAAMPEPVASEPGDAWVVDQGALPGRHDLAVFDGTASAPGAVRAGQRATEPFVQAGAAPVTTPDGTFLRIEHASGDPTWICIASNGVSYATLCE